MAAEIIDLTNDDTRFEQAIIRFYQTKSEDDLLQAKIYYYRKRLEYESFIKAEDEEFLRGEYGMGFWFALSEYNTNPTILRFMAKCMTDEIIEVAKASGLEKKVHFQFDKAQDLREFGLRRFIIKTLKEYDNTLSGYASLHIDVLINAEKELNNILNNWETYVATKDIDPEIVFEILHEFVSYTDECDYSAIELAYYLKYELNIDCLTSIEKYDEFEEETLSDEEYYGMIFRRKSIQDERVLLDLEKVMYNYIYKNTIPDPYVETEKRKRRRKKNK